MKIKLTIILLSLATLSFSQNVKSDTIRVPLTPFQLNEIATIEKQIQDLTNKKNYLLNLIVDANQGKTDSLMLIGFDNRKRALVLKKIKK